MINIPDSLIQENVFYKGLRRNGFTLPKKCLLNNSIVVDFTSFIALLMLQ